MVPLVFDDIIAAEPFRVRWKLGGDQLVELVLREGARLSQALPADTKRLRSDYVIENEGDHQALERSAASVWEALLARA